MGSIGILFINSARGIAGGLTSSLDLVTGLAKAGERIVAACHPRSELRQWLEARGVTVAPVAIRAEINIFRTLQLARLIRKFSPDVVLADRRKDVKMAWAALRLQPGAALVHRNGAPSPLRDTRLYRAIWSDVDRMVVNSQFMRETLLQQTPWISRTPMDVIYNGKDLDYWRPMPDESAAVRTELGIPQDAFVVQFHGVLQPRKNVDLLILASALLPAPVHALIVGDGPEAGRLRDLARTADLPATFTGFRSDLPRVLAAADAMVHMSRAEGFSNSVVEALACGLPVVASDATSHREQVEDDRTGWLVEPDNARAVADKLEILQRDPELRRRMSTAARQQAVDNYDIRRMVDRYVQVLLRAVNSP